MTVHQLTVAEDRTPRASTLVRIEHLTIDLPVVALLFSSKPLTVRVADVHIDLRRRQDGQWNLTSVLQALGTSTSAGSPGGAIVPRLNRQIAITVTHGTLHLGEEAEFTDLAIELHWAARRLTITQADARLAGGVMALRGAAALQEPTPSQVLHWRLAGIRLEQVLWALPFNQSPSLRPPDASPIRAMDGFWRPRCRYPCLPWRQGRSVNASRTLHTWP